MPKLDIYSTTAKKTSSADVKPKLFNLKDNPHLIAQAVRVYLSNQRQASARTKSRSQIKVSKSKIWRQKGTGRARHGSRNAPIFVGGAKAHGPTGTQNFKLKMPQKMKRLSLLTALSRQFKNQNIVCLSGLEKLELKTKKFDQILKKVFKKPQKILFIISNKQKKLLRPIKNLSYLTTLNNQSLNTYQVLKAQKLVFTKQALKEFQEQYAD